MCLYNDHTKQHIGTCVHNDGGWRWTGEGLIATKNYTTTSMSYLPHFPYNYFLLIYVGLAYLACNDDKMIY